MDVLGSEAIERERERLSLQAKGIIRRRRLTNCTRLEMAWDHFYIVGQP